MHFRHEWKHELSRSEKPLVKELCYKMQTESLAPKTIVAA